MTDGRKEHIRRRGSALDEDRLAGDDGGAVSGRGRTRSSNKRLQRLLPFLVFAFIFLMIARKEIPVVGAWWDRTFSPGDWAARQVCYKAALARAPNGEFARVIETGDVHRTQEGVYIDDLVLGEMGENGIEVRVDYACYVNEAGDLVKLTRVGIRSPGKVAPESD
jgi:hypothetical protein